MSPARKREAVLQLREQLDMSERRACRVLSQPRSSQRRKSQPRDDEPALRKRIHELVRERPRFGYRRIAALLRAEGHRASATRILRLWRQEGLKVPQKKRKRRRLGVSSNGLMHRRAEAKNDVWTWDFVFDRTIAGSPLKWLSIVDEYTRECLALKVDRNITSEDVIDTLAELLAMRGVPRCIRSDNGKLCKPGKGMSNGRACSLASPIPFFQEPRRCDSWQLILASSRAWRACTAARMT